MKIKDTVSSLSGAVSTVFFIGYLPLIPGTFGSLFGVGLFFSLRDASSPAYFLAAVSVIVLGFLTAGRTERMSNRKDPGYIVIDEVAGMLVGLAFMPSEPRVVILGFLIFRILDTLKPYPASRLQNCHGAFGIMADDLAAGVYTNIVLRLGLLLSR
ncbi:MAG: phosphatidylglycerophosphatase A [Candidatus Omnitrophica bacterium]|jgi:phosphatidylglycerophosphatase A|nr:phosphatidylglycerophosphatase A [Candidatus Omnitrophota bacterium]MDD3274127.1 phosphatidylglycerophosphatase A [Candidatus Omnitrophota bacterium]MDD5724530.1 phosphatidylglycerophosphatase A [Candidatus Omnitrophota bacterium]